jgi:phospholipase/lecithinase/hemolysin
LCPRYKGLSEEAILNPDPASQGCTSFAVGGGRIHPLGILNRSFSSTPFSLTQQMRDLAAADAYADNDVLLVIGGGNDAADLLGAYLKADSDQGLVFSLLISELLSSSEVFKAMTNGRDGRMAAGHLHMQALANRLVDHMKPDALDKGAKRVVVVNMPDVSRTPRFTALLTNRNDASTLSTLTSAWVTSYNQQLQARLAAYADRVLVIDFFAALNAWLDQPSAYGLADPRTPACPVVGTDSNGLPKFNLATCAESNLAAGWEGHVFADGFHGTPRVNQLLADVVLQAMRAKGWR